MRRKLKRRYGRAARTTSYFVHMGGPKATEVVKLRSDGWHWRLWDGSPWEGPVSSRGYAIERRDLALRARRGGGWG